MTFNLDAQNGNIRPGRSLQLAIALLSCALIAYQVNLLHIFSFAQWYHFAYMAISIALLGFGAAGSVLTMFEKQLLGSYDTAFPALCFIASVCMGGFMAIQGIPGLHYEAFHFKLSSLTLLKLIGAYLLLTIPFFFAALCIGLTFTKYTTRIGRLYALDLIGAGIGALLAIFLSFRFLPHHTGILLAVLPLLAGVLSFGKTTRKGIWIMAIFTIFSLGFLYQFTANPQPSEYKSLYKTLLLPDAKVEYHGPHPHGTLHVISSPVLRHAPGLSLTYDGDVPIVRGIFRNGEWIGPLGDQSISDTTHLYDFTSYALPFILSESGDVLIVGDPGAAMSKYAIRHAYGRVVSLFESDDLVALLQDRYAAETDSIAFHPQMHFKVDHMRSLLLRDTSLYDLIILPDIGSFGGSGLHAIRENYVLTRENLALAWDRLSPSGSIALHCWLDAPSRAPLRTYHLLIDLLRSHEMDSCLHHITAVKDWGRVTYVLRKSPWDEVNYSLADSFCTLLDFDPIINHGRILDLDEMTHSSQESSFYTMIAHISRGSDKVFGDYDFDLSVPTDNRPFFNHFVKISRFKKLMQVYGGQGLFVEMGYFFVLLTLIFITIFAFIFILLPFFRIGFSGPLRGFTLLYFGAIGIGYMCIEIAFIHRSIPYLGAPVYAFSTTLAALLISSGLGSAFSRRFTKGIDQLKKYGFILLMILVAYSVAANSTWGFVGQVSSLRLLAAFILIGIPGFFMGMFFPLGLRFLSNSGVQSMVPLAWAINGFFSVISAVLAMVLAVELGFEAVIILAVGVYGVAILVSWSRHSR